jgi:hypothetical protein
MKFCFRCKKYYPSEQMRPKFNQNGRCTGIECINCVKQKKTPLFGRGLNQECVQTTESQVASKIQD